MSTRIPATTAARQSAKPRSSKARAHTPGKASRAVAVALGFVAARLWSARAAARG